MSTTHDAVTGEVAALSDGLAESGRRLAVVRGALWSLEGRSAVEAVPDPASEAAPALQRYRQRARRG